LCNNPEWQGWIVLMRIQKYAFATLLKGTKAENCRGMRISIRESDTITKPA
jgi:hypothetical protein